MAQKIDLGLILLLAVASIPLAVRLPYSAAALVMTAGLLAVLNASLFARLAHGRWAVLLQAANAGALVAALGTALGSALLVSTLTIALVSLTLFLLATLEPTRHLILPRLAVQQFAFVAVLLCWLVLRQVWPTFVSDRALSAGSFVAGLRALFAAPLLLVIVVWSAARSGWRGWPIALAGVCAGQWSIAFFELGAELRSLTLVGLAFILGAVFLLLLVYAVMARPVETATGAT